MKGIFWSSKLLSTEEKDITAQISKMEWYTEMRHAKIYFGNSDDIALINRPYLLEINVYISHKNA